jgi:hypothetical protein
MALSAPRSLERWRARSRCRGSLPFSRFDSISDSVWGFGDVMPIATLRWNAGVNNYMTYITGDVPVGAYDSNRLSNIGIGHGAIDGGFGYTYLNP